MQTRKNEVMGKVASDVAEGGAMSKPEILMLVHILPEAMEALDRRYETHHFWDLEDKAAFLAERGNRIRAIVTGGATGASRDLMQQLPNLELITCYGVGVDAIDLTYAAERGVLVTTTPDLLTDDVADLAIALMLAVSRNIVQGDAFVRSGEWLKGGMSLTRKMTGKAAGIVGLGRIGRAVAHRLEAFSMRIAYTGRAKKDGVSYQYYATPVELAKASDFLIVTASATADNVHLIDAAVFQALGPEGVLINVARGSLVDQAQLIEALAQKEIAGAGLDVFEKEPLADPMLCFLSNVVLQPHQGSGTIESRTGMSELILSNLAAHFEGRPLVTPYSSISRSK